MSEELTDFIKQTFENWDMECLDSVRDVMLSFKNFSNSLKNSCTDVVYSLVEEDSSGLLLLFNLFPSVETMKKRNDHELFRQLYSEAVMFVVNLLQVPLNHDGDNLEAAVEKCLMKHSTFIGDLLYLHNIMKPSKNITSQMFCIIEDCHGTILNVYSYCALINLVGIDDFVNLVMNEKKKAKSFLANDLLPFLRKTNYEPSILLAEKIAFTLQNKYKISNVKVEQPLSLSQQMAIADADAMETAREEVKQAKTFYNNWSLLTDDITFAFVVLVVGLMISLLSIEQYWTGWKVVWSLFVLIVCGGVWFRWGRKSMRQRRRAEKMLKEEEQYYGSEAWTVMERGREAQRKKMLEKS